MVKLFHTVGPVNLGKIFFILISLRPLCLCGQSIFYSLVTRLTHQIAMQENKNAGTSS